MSKKEKKNRKRGKRIPLKENPLYPPKQESSAIGILIAIVIVIAVIVLDVMLMDAIEKRAYKEIMQAQGISLCVSEINMV